MEAYSKVAGSVGEWLRGVHEAGGPILRWVRTQPKPEAEAEARRLSSNTQHAIGAEDRAPCLFRIPPTPGHQYQ